MLRGLGLPGDLPNELWGSHWREGAKAACGSRHRLATESASAKGTNEDTQWQAPALGHIVDNQTVSWPKTGTPKQVDLPLASLRKWRKAKSPECWCDSFNMRGSAVQRARTP